MNSIQILGAITRDLELKYTQSGVAIGSFGLAYNEKRKQQDGSYGDVAHFFDCTAFGKTAENINSYFQKGSRILILGSLDFQSWNDADGKKRSKVGIKVGSFDFIDKRSDSSQQPQQGYQAPAQQPYQSYAPQQQQTYQPQQQAYKPPPTTYENAQGRPVPPPQQQQRPQQPPVINIDEQEIPF